MIFPKLSVPQIHFPMATLKRAQALAHAVPAGCPCDGWWPKTGWGWGPEPPARPSPGAGGEGIDPVLSTHNPAYRLLQVLPGQELQKQTVFKAAMSFSTTENT